MYYWKIRALLREVFKYQFTTIQSLKMSGASLAFGLLAVKKKAQQPVALYFVCR